MRGRLYRDRRVLCFAARRACYDAAVNAPSRARGAVEPIVDPPALPAARILRLRVAAAGLPPDTARPGAARPGESIVLVGGIGRGGAAVLAAACGAWLGRRVPPADLVQAAGWPDGPGWDVAAIAARLDSLAAAGNDHPALGASVALGDGGLARACHAIARASDAGLWIDAGTVPLHAATARICDALGLNPLEVQSGGALLATAMPSVARTCVEQLSADGFDAVIVGKVVAGPASVTLAMGGTQRPLGCPERDAVDAILGVEPPAAA